MIVPPWIYGAAGLVALAGGFAAGWKVRDWKCDADTAAIYQAGIDKAKKDQLAVGAAATVYEGERSDAQAAERDRAETIRTVWRDRSAVPGDCAAPDASVRVLAEAVDAANARARGEPGGGLPEPTATAEPAGR